MPLQLKIPHIQRIPPLPQRITRKGIPQLPSGAAFMGLVRQQRSTTSKADAGNMVIDDDVSDPTTPAAPMRFGGIRNPTRLNEVLKDIGERETAYRHRNYLGKIVINKDIADTLHPFKAKYLHANNLRSRSDYARISNDVLSNFLWNETRELWWVTLIPTQFHLSFDDAVNFDVQKIIGWVHAVLPKLNCIAIVEAGCVPVPRTKGSQIEVSFHVHLIGWGWSRHKIMKTRVQVNKRFPHWFSTVRAMHVRQVDPREALEKISYMNKAPTKDYRFWKGYEVIDRETGEVIKSRRDKRWSADIRSGHFARMQMVMHDRFIDQLWFAKGEGKALLDRINRRALSAYHREEALRSRR